MINLYNHIVEYLINAPAIIQFTWVLSVVFLFVIIGLIIYLNHIRKRLRSKERIETVYEKKYEQDLIKYLYSGNKDQEITNEQQIIVNYLRQCASSSLKRKLISNTLLKLRNEISGEMADAIQKLYYQTGLLHYASSKLKNKKWETIASGIKELAQFEIKEVHDEVLLHVNHPKREVRLEIQRYLVKLFRFEGLEFLNLLVCRLTEWDQIRLIEILKKFENQETPDFSVWLESSNNSVVSFSLKLTKTFNQYEAKDTLIKLLSHSDPAIRIEALEVLSHFGDIESFIILKNDFNQRTIEEQEVIFKIMESLYEISDVPFILDHINNENFEIKTSALKILKAIDDDEGYHLKTLTNNIEFLEKTNLNNAS
ncbi:HEAT repeat domain-containing protein [Flavobacterium cellulosilyticum]|uniref:HEAT repeat domain-containing protein n=1 Tax=Flavobacterium cellulosilyticum TaxID=2541731 RepID=A0A4V2YZW5_9FLAO|nr:HEAT repeat domain-containing protein [Flavobacterium cellulosilyticum]TDD98677.1 HEAT repeat domain-containing protein [Flavobacterium cellulosilyticum]